jgi:hypothetical protein
MLFVAVGNTTFGEIVGGELKGDAVASEYADTILPKLACQVRQHHSFLVELYAEFTVWQFFDHNASNFD